jgi:aryl-alcohol dehydrogenase-like predicted oxidoreductase
VNQTECDSAGQREFGATGLRVSAFGLGCGRIGSLLGGCTGADAIRLVHHALARGIRVFDTADIYGQGESERLLGAALRRQRASVVLATKAGQCFTPLQRAAVLARPALAMLARRLPVMRRGIAAGRARPLRRDFSAGHLRRALHRSLRRLQTDYIDIFLLHGPSAADLAAHDGALEPLLAEFLARGTIRCWGISCDDAATFERALAYPTLGAVQIPLALCRAAPHLLDRARRRGVGLMLREIYATPDGVPATAATRAAGLAAARGIDGAVTLIGTTNTAHLDAALTDGLPSSP